MKLRTSFFNPTVFKKDLTRFAPTWALYTVWPHHKTLSNRKCIKGFYYRNEMIYLSTRLQTFGISYTLK